MKKYTFRPQKLPALSKEKNLWIKSFLIKLEHDTLEWYLNFKTKIKVIAFPWIYKIKRNWAASIILFTVICVLGNYTFLNLKQSLRNIQENKSGLLDKIKSIINKNDKDQIKVLNEIETKLIQDLEPIADNPITGVVVRSDISKIKNITAKWLDLLYPFKNYKFGTDGFNSTLLNERFFSQDVELLLTKSPQLINETRNQLNGFWIYRIFGNSDIQESLNIIVNVLDILEILAEKKETILTMLGHYQTQKVVIFNQNNGEARPTGGFIGSYIPVDIIRGQIKIGQSQSIYYFDKGSKSELLTHPAMWNYGLFDGLVDPHGARNSNVFPCFPDTARYLEREFSKSENGYNIDDVVFLSPDFMLGYLPDDFNLQIGEELIPKNKILNKIEQITAIEIEDKNNPKKQITSIFNLLINQLPQILKGQALIDLITYTQDSLLARSIQVWFRSPSIQKLWQTTGLAGTNTCQNLNENQIITPIIINLSGDKRNLITSTDFDIVKNGNNLKIRWSQSLPQDANNLLQRGYIDNGITMVGFQVPTGNKLINIQSKDMLNLPFLRDYYIQQLQFENQNKYNLPPEIESLIRSSFDIDTDKKDKGFVYLQPDGSQVFGVYVYDKWVKQITQNPLQVVFDVELNGDNSEMYFYNQPNLNNTKLNFNNTEFIDKTELQKGIKLF